MFENVIEKSDVTKDEKLAFNYIEEIKKILQ